MHFPAGTGLPPKSALMPLAVLRSLITLNRGWEFDSAAFQEVRHVVVELTNYITSLRTGRSADGC
jgi:hypothetical protein